ncbi:DNA-binding protein [Arthrobacter crystallopoietes BAB-32]|uniref:DNA-binding protein n=1 Tax=Arthrobacter crystallopoietes BAB-32 TaxID=1246476 RepID=N1UZN2_9MICC|nr:helix-turn-helix transcriptional regulator [Arthrobacter crystallopoietes]EMY35846.1 DNA-binding protein [Arthrobacter crystallopoietes BAB-32]
MALKFRNLTVSPEDPVETWGFEGLLAAIERGDRTHWRRIAEALEADPRGEVAQDLREVLAAVENPAMVALFESIQQQILQEAEAHERAAVATRLQEYVRASGLSRAEFAARLGTSQSRLSTYLSGKVVPSAVLMVRAERIAGTSGNGASRQPATMANASRDNDDQDL